MAILVTGATGFVGGHVARLLDRRGASLRVLVRPDSRRDNLEGLHAEVVVGDLRDAASLRSALRGCEMVFHAAADYRLWARDPGELYQVNVTGTATLMNEVRDSAVKRVIYTSTVGTMRPPAEGQVTDEDQPASLEDMAGDYKRSKFLAEKKALEFNLGPLQVVAVNPTAPVGESDIKPTPTGRIILDFLRGRMPAYIDTGLNLVDVRAVAEGHLAAAEKGRPGERYILGDRNLTLREILEKLSGITGIPAPRVRMPYAVAYAAAVAGTVLSRVTGREPRAPLDAVRMARHKMFVRCGKAERELGFRPAEGSVEEALRRAVEYFQQHFQQHFQQQGRAGGPGTASDARNHLRAGV